MPTSLIDIDYIRATGTGSSGEIFFYPPRVKVGAALLSREPVRAVVENGKGSVELVQLPNGYTYRASEQIAGSRPHSFHFALSSVSPNTIQYEDIAQVDPVPATYTAVRSVNGTTPDPTTGNVVIEVAGTPGPKGDPGDDGADGADGLNGSNGFNGTNGADGADGIDGEDGLNGADGAVGPQGPAGRPVDFVAARFGCKALTMSPHALSAGAQSGGLKFIAMWPGRIFMHRLAVPEGETLSKIRIPIAAVGSGPGSVWCAIYQSDFSLLGLSADVGPALSAGVPEWRDVMLLAPGETTDDFVWVAALSTLGTGPQLCFSEIDNLSDFYWLLNTSGQLNAMRLDDQTALPGTLNPASGERYSDYIVGVA